MIGTCTLCGTIVQGKEVAGVQVAVERSARNGTHQMISDEQREEIYKQALAARDVQNFDLLAAAMVNHIMTEHGRQQPAFEMMSAGNLAAKVYIMRSMISTDAKYVQLRDAWSLSIRNMLFPDQPATVAAPGDSGPPTPPPLDDTPLSGPPS
jgi:hypothetical protein